MSVTVKHLNADSTFLLIFSPEPQPLPRDLKSANGAYTVLIDPWLIGSSIVSARWFAITRHVVPSAIQHLSQIEEPDVVIVSQNKPDHCHKETLLQLRPEGKTIIAAEPGAAKAIKSWDHFDPNRIYGLNKYDPKAKFGNSLRLRIPPLSPNGHPGEVNISFIPAKNYMTGLHNAIGVTYQPPTHKKSISTVATVDLPKSTKYFHMPLSPISLPPASPQQLTSPTFDRSMSLDIPRHANQVSLSSRSPKRQGHRPQLSRSSNTASSEFLPISEIAIIQPESNSTTEVESYETDRSSSTQISVSSSPFDFGVSSAPTLVPDSLPTPPDSPDRTLSFSAGFHQRTSLVPSHRQSLSSLSSNPTLLPITPGRPKAVSVLYTPHGIPLADLQPYVQSHLVKLPGALPLSLLLHSFDHAQNPWYLGGNIMSGAAGGIEIAQALMARCWLSAHDEPKDDRGISVKQLKVKRLSADNIRQALWQGQEGEWLRKKGWVCDVRNLDVGKDLFIGPARDLCIGLEGKRHSQLLKFGPG